METWIFGSLMDSSYLSTAQQVSSFTHCLGIEVRIANPCESDLCRALLLPYSTPTLTDWPLAKLLVFLFTHPAAS